MVQLASQSTLRSSSRRTAKSSALMSVVIVVVPIAQARSPPPTDVGSMAERLPRPDETPAVEEHDCVALDRQTHSGAAASFRQRLHHNANGLGAGGIIHDVHPFLELAILVPGRMLELLETRRGNAAIELGRRQHADMGRIAQPL